MFFYFSGSQDGTVLFSGPGGLVAVAMETWNLSPRGNEARGHRCPRYLGISRKYGNIYLLHLITIDVPNSHCLVDEKRGL
jgi:hypothetical protein